VAAGLLLCQSNLGGLGGGGGGPKTTPLPTGRVYTDSNSSCSSQSAEPGFAGLEVRLVRVDTGAVVATAWTNASGEYWFASVWPFDPTPPDYRVVLPSPPPSGVQQPGGTTCNLDGTPHSELVPGGLTGVYPPVGPVINFPYKP